MASNLYKVGFAEAVAYSYNGLGPNRVDCFSSGNPQFFFIVPKFDKEAIEAEMKDKTVTVFLPSMLTAIRDMLALVELARASGVWSAATATKKK